MVQLDTVYQAMRRGGPRACDVRKEERQIFTAQPLQKQGDPRVQCAPVLKVTLYHCNTITHTSKHTDSALKEAD